MPEKTKDKSLVRIVDDDEALRESIEFMLLCEGYDVMSFSGPEDFLARDLPSRVGCVVLDVEMPSMTGLQLQALLNRRSYQCPIVFLTAHGDIDMAVQTMRDGACDFHQKPIQPESFLKAIARAVEIDRARRLGASDIKDEILLFESLSRREEQICREVARGLTSRIIAERLGISKRTVDHVRASVIAKLKLRTPAELAGFFERIDAFRQTVESHV